ncbi:NAD synthetase [Bacillus sp. SG-1]|nr:NAD synthetase [Bacillus sp. SG-1]
MKGVLLIDYERARGVERAANIKGAETEDEF